MKREKLLTFVVVLLFVLNISTISFLFFERGHRPPPPVRMEKLIPQTLGFSQTQIQQFDLLREEHHARMVALDEQNKETLIQYLQLLKTDSIHISEKDSLEKIVAVIQLKRAQITLEHFQQLKAVCTAEQKEKFNQLIPELIRVMVPPSNKEPRP